MPKSLDLPPAPESIQVAPPTPLKADQTPKFKIVEERSSLPAPVISEQAEFHLDDIIPTYLPAAQVHLFSGASGAGKTSFTFAMLKCMFDGTEFFGLPFIRKPAFVGYLAADRTWKDHALWMKTVQLDSLPYYSLIGDRSISGKALRKAKNSDRFELFERCIAVMLMKQKLAPEGISTKAALSYTPKDSLFIVDPISLFMGGDLNKYDSVYTHMLDFNQFCEYYQCTIIGLAHASKQKGGADEQYARPQDRINGTTAQTGCAGTTLHLAPPTETKNPKGTTYELGLFPRHAGEKILYIKRNDIGLFVETDNIPDEPPSNFDLTPAQVKKLNKQKEIFDRMLGILIEEETYIDEILERASLPIAKGGLDCKRSMVYSYLKVMCAEGLIEPGKEGYWKKKKQN